ncbi:MAG: RNA polymerase sigma-70 factor [Muribaculaceae bacterium]|nr:RNA polymerase sigma-70 factor [Muribaculaceae bacterium]
MTVKEFETYFRKMYLPLGMYALRIVGNADDAEDIVEDSFIKAWQTISSGAELCSFNSYIYRCVRNECISFLRKRKEYSDIDSIPDVCEEDIDTSIRDARIWKAIDELPDKCRKIFLMSKQDGLSNAEIAEELNISVKTVKNQMTKAFHRLRKSLDSAHKPFFLPFL